MITARDRAPARPLFLGHQAGWLLDAHEGARERARRGELLFGTVDSYLIWKLTGGQAHVTDATNAARTLLYNIHLGAWDPEICDLLGVPLEMLPEVRDCAADFGSRAPTSSAARSRSPASPATSRRRRSGRPASRREC